MTMAHTHLQHIANQPQLRPFCTRNLELRVFAVIREIGDIVVLIRKVYEAVNKGPAS